MEHIGSRLRELRKRNKVSLLELAKCTQMSYSFLSQLENGKYSITIANLQRLAEFFGVDMVYFLQHNDPDKIHVTRKSNPALPAVEEGMVYQILTTGDEEHMQVSRVQLPMNFPDAQHLRSHATGDEVLYVLSGCLSVQVGENNYVLELGDTIYYPATYGHYMAAIEEGTTFFLIRAPAQKE